nr:hypothetical protein [Rhodoferax sp.]
MSKLLSVLIAAVFATASFGAIAASHGGAMKDGMKMDDKMTAACKAMDAKKMDDKKMTEMKMDDKMKAMCKTVAEKK